jgi:hypothetical protein
MSPEKVDDPMLSKRKEREEELPKNEILDHQ